MITVGLNETSHDFEKRNLVSMRDGSGSYDVYRCRKCGIEGKSRGLGRISLDGRAKKKAVNCPEKMPPAKIKITICRAFGPVFANLVPESIHEVIEAPEGYDNERGVWVMGVGTPVKVLFGEFTEVV